MFLLLMLGVCYTEQSSSPAPSVIDFRSGQVRILDERQRLTILVVGEGYRVEERQSFEEDSLRFQAKLFSMHPYKDFRGIWTVSQKFVASASSASPQGKGYFGLQTKPVDDRLHMLEPLSNASVRRFFGILRSSLVNLLKVQGLYDHVFIVVLVNAGPGRTVSGYAKEIKDPDSDTRVRVAFAENSVHEFGHAFAHLKDEYVLDSGISKIAQERPAERDLWRMSNLIYSQQKDQIPWFFLFPQGTLNLSAKSVIGRLWAGGLDESGVYHCEPYCLMNGKHANWSLDKSRRGAGLRNENRLCFWCEDIVASQLAAHAGLLHPAQDGVSQWQAWESYRPFYQKWTNLASRISEANLVYDRMRIDHSPLIAPFKG